MASYRGHLMFATPLGAAYGGLAWWQYGFEWDVALLGAGVTALGGMLPDLDSDSGVPVRTLFGVAAAAVPLLMLRRMLTMDMQPGQMICIMAATYCLIRFVVSALFKKITVHRGMYHSVPAMLIAGLAVFLFYHDPNQMVRYFIAGGVMLGFLSHLVLDEMCSVNMVGVKVQLNQFAGSAVKFFSASWIANLVTYAMLACLAFVAAMEFDVPRSKFAQVVNSNGLQNTWLARFANSRASQ